MPECTYLASITSPPGLLSFSTTHLLCINSSGSVFRYQYPTVENSDSTPTVSVWEDAQDSLHVPISSAPVYVSEDGNAQLLANRTIISLFWHDSCGYDMIFPKDATSEFAHYLGLWTTCETSSGMITFSDHWEFQMLVPTSGKLQQ